MTGENHELTAHARRLIQVERLREGPTPTEVDRVFNRLASTNAFTASTSNALFKGTALKVVSGVLAGALLGGGVTGAWFSHQFTLAQAELTEARRAIPQSAVALVPAVPVQPANEETVTPLAANPLPRAAPERTVRPKVTVGEAPKGKDDTSAAFRAEAALIEQTRTALLKGDFTLAALALEEHRTRFTLGQMAEERDVLHIQVLLGQQHLEEAQEAAERFKRLHPASVLRETVDELFAHE